MRNKCCRTLPLTHSCPAECYGVGESAVLGWSSLGLLSLRAGGGMMLSAAMSSAGLLPLHCSDHNVIWASFEIICFCHGQMRDKNGWT